MLIIWLEEENFCISLKTKGFHLIESYSWGTIYDKLASCIWAILFCMIRLFPGRLNAQIKTEDVKHQLTQQEP